MSRRIAPSRRATSWLEQYPYDLTRMERREIREEGKDKVISMLVLLFVTTVLVSLSYSTITLRAELNAAKVDKQVLLAQVGDLQTQLAAATGTDVQSASLIVGQDEDVETSFGKLRVSATFLKPRTEYDARIAVSAKFLDKGYSIPVPTDGTWHTRNSGWQYRIAPDGYSVGYEWNYDKQGNFTTLKNSYQYYMLQWRPEPEVEEWELYDQAVEKGITLTSQ